MRSDEGLLLDILLAGRQAIFYGENLSREEFLESRLHQDAILRQLTIIGEAAGLLSEELRTSYHDIPWQKIRAFRNVVVHAYFEVDLEQVWKILQQDLPDLLEQIEPLVPQED